jgi:hypothetical protein
MRRFARLLGLLLLVFDALMVGGMFAAALGHRIGAYAMLAGALGLFATHLAVGIGAYVSVMRRPWPVVPPLGSEDWDD